MPGGLHEGRTERILLLLCDKWSDLGDGVATINRSLALHLSSFKGVKVYSTILSDINSLSKHDQQDADNNQVTLIGPALDANVQQEPELSSEIYIQFNTDPLSLFPNLSRVIPFVTHIIGHSPLTGEAAIRYLIFVLLKYSHLFDKSW